MEVEEKIDNPKLKYYTGIMVTSENYNQLSSEDRSFWNKAHKSFQQGKFYFKHKGKEFVVPFRLKDGTFDSIAVSQNLNNKFVEAQQLKVDRLEKQEVEESTKSAEETENNVNKNTEV